MDERGRASQGQGRQQRQGQGRRPRQRQQRRAQAEPPQDPDPAPQEGGAPGGDPGQGRSGGWDAGALAGVVVTTLAAMIGLFMVDLSSEALITLDYGGLVGSVITLLVLLPLPAAFIAHISHSGFRREALATVIALPFGLLGLKFAAFAAGLVLGGLMVSYKAENLWQDGNTFWTGWKASGGAVTMLAIVLGLAVAFTYQGSATFREDVRGELTNVTTDVATEQINLTQQGVVDQQTEALVTSAGTVAENASTAAIILTTNQVLTAVQDDGSFSPTQQNLLISEFGTARDDIPPQIGQQTRDAVRQQVEANQGGLVPVQDTADMIADQTRRMLRQFGQPSPPVFAVIVLMVASVVLMFKLPFSLIAGLYAVLISVVMARLRA